MIEAVAGDLLTGDDPDLTVVSWGHRTSGPSSGLAAATVGREEMYFMTRLPLGFRPYSLVAARAGQRAVGGDDDAFDLSA